MMRGSKPGSRRPVSTKEGGLDRLIWSLLLVGLGVGLAFMLAGVLLALFHDGRSMPHTTTFTGLFRSLASFEADGVFGLGLFILLATPAARVLAGMLFFGRGRQWRFVFIGLFVLAILSLSAFLGLRG
jgi:uncharacterized membrane protein